ncbi:unnamed protein product [Periconia digitata]|uniref:Uncharacterized protein n=1 Tax=Periconia digitata TaxID=1303443 RepID=A0A9W4U2N3_9PLEO|nr:unnamed protein product [Periconia digitata]
MAIFPFRHILLTFWDMVGTKFQYLQSGNLRKPPPARRISYSCFPRLGLRCSFPDWYDVLRSQSCLAHHPDNVHNHNQGSICM